MTQSARLLKFDRCLTVGYSQWITATTLGLSHGGNDAQKAMEFLAMGLVAFGVLPEFSVPTWVAPVSTTQVSASSIIGAGAAERRKKSALGPGG